MRPKAGIGRAAILHFETAVSCAANGTLVAVAEESPGLSEPIWRWDRLHGSALEGRDPLRGGLDVFSPYDEKGRQSEPRLPMRQLVRHSRECRRRNTFGYWPTNTATATHRIRCCCRTSGTIKRYSRTCLHDSLGLAPGLAINTYQPLIRVNFRPKRRQNAGSQRGRRKGK